MLLQFGEHHEQLIIQTPTSSLSMLDSAIFAKPLERPLDMVLLPNLVDAPAAAHCFATCE